MSPDRVYLMGRPEGVLAAERLFSKEREARRVCIVGGGVVGKAIARDLLHQEATVMLIESDLATAEEVSAEFQGIEVVHGDGTDRALLEDHEVPVDPVQPFVTWLNASGCAISAE